MQQRSYRSLLLLSLTLSPFGDLPFSPSPSLATRPGLLLFFFFFLLCPSEVTVTPIGGWRGEGGGEATRHLQRDEEKEEGEERARNKSQERSCYRRKTSALGSDLIQLSNPIYCISGSLFSMRTATVLRRILLRVMCIVSTVVLNTSRAHKERYVA